MKLNKFIITLLIFSLMVLPVFAGISNDAKLEYNKGVDYYQLGQYDLAIDSFKKATELDPNYIDAYFNMGSLLEYLNQNEEALNAFKQIILRKPDDYESVYKAAELSKKVGNPDKAKMYLSLIPVDSLIGQRASKLASTLETDLPTIQAEQSRPKSFAEAKPNDDSNGMYSDITSPTGIVADNNGNLYIAGFSDNTIYKIGSDNKKIVYIKDKKIDGPIGIAIDDDGNIYIANYNKDNVLKVDTGGIVSELISNVKNPYCMHINGNLLFVSSQGSNSVIRYKLH